MNMLKSFIFVLMVALTTPALADCDPSTCMVNQLSIGYGPVRENDGADYRTFRFDDRMFEHFEANVGGIIGGDVPQTGLHDTDSKFDYRTIWIGGSFIEVEQYLFGSVGIVRLSRQTAHLTSPYQFLIQFGVHYDAVSLTYVHLSNGHTGGKNYGEDMLVLGYGF